jgi:hypothetical protein
LLAGGAADARQWAATPAAPLRWYPVSGGAWEVGPELVAQMRDAVAQATGKPADEYVVQYQGVRSEGRRFVRLEGMCQVNAYSPADLRRIFMIVLDGGKCYFDARYELEPGRLIDFAYHGQG